MLETPMFTRVVNVVNVQRAVFQGARGGKGERRGDAEMAETRRMRPKNPNPIESNRTYPNLIETVNIFHLLTSDFCFLDSPSRASPQRSEPFRTVPNLKMFLAAIDEGVTLDS